MGEIFEYTCSACKNIFTARVGRGRKPTPQYEPPTKCPKCNSTDIIRGAKKAYWD